MQRIEEMEKNLHHQVEMLRQLEEVAKAYEASQSEYQDLQDYYYSDQYMQDFDAAGRGEFDKIPAGILSEDAIYNLIMDRQQVAISLLELATKMLKVEE